MSWFEKKLPSLSNLKDQISNVTNVTKEGLAALSEGIIEERDERSLALRDANEKCVRLEEVLQQKNAEISLLRRQNTESLKRVIELNGKLNANDPGQNDGGGEFFWDPPVQHSKPNVQLLEEQLSEASMKIRELEAELKQARMVSDYTVKEELPENRQNPEVLRAKQNMMNRIIQMEEKRNTKYSQLDENTFVNEFRSAFLKLDTTEKQDLIKSALKAVYAESDNHAINGQEEYVGDQKIKCEKAPGLDLTSKKETEYLKKIETLEEENKSLQASLEELDEMHGKEMEKLVSVMDEGKSKHVILQKAYEQLYVDYNQAESKAAELEKRMALAESEKHIEVQKSVNCQSLQTDEAEKEEKNIQTETQSDESIEIKVIENLTQKLKDILKNNCIEVKSGETIFEGIAKHYVEAKWKQDVLEKKLMEISKDLKESNEAKEVLQTDFDVLQDHLDSVLLENQHLKLNLPSIPEASEERVASLETETESLQEEIKRLDAENKILLKKNSELEAALQCVKDSSVNHESPEIEIKNKKDHSAENIENKESIVRDLASKLQASLEENDELKRKINLLKNAESQMQEQLRMSLEKCKGLDENIELIEELKLDLANVKEELKGSIINSKQLDNTVKLLQKDKDELENENEYLHQNSIKMEEELGKWREMNNREDKELLEKIQKELDFANLENTDLEYDICNMRKELDYAMDQITKLNRDNEKLIKENTSLSELLTITENESGDKIELLNTEMSVLQQEHTELKQSATYTKKELDEANEKLRNTEEKYIEYKNKCNILNETIQKLQLEKQTFEDSNSDDKVKINQLEELLRNKSEEGKLLHSKDEHLQNVLSNCERLESEVNQLQTEKQSLLNLLSTLNEKVQENEEINSINEKLKAEIVEIQTKLQVALDKSNEAASMAKETIESLSNIIKEKDNEINELKSKVNSETIESQNILTLRNERNELVKLVQTKHNESLQYHAEIQRLESVLLEKVAEIQKLTSEQSINLDLINEKDALLLWLQNELQVAQQRQKNAEKTQNSEVCGIVQHSTLASDMQILTEKCNALEAALIQEQTNNRILQNQFNECQQKQGNAEKELGRLRQHLVEMESNYTEEALLAEAMRQELEGKLMQAEEKMKNNSTAYTSANIRANQQVETLQQQISLIIQQRDDIQNKLSFAEDKILSQTAALTNLQIVLEQFQRDKEKDIAEATEKLNRKLKESDNKQQELVYEISNLKEQLLEAKEFLQAASRLSEELDRKAEKINQLTEEVQRLKELGNSADQKIEKAKQSEEGKVDKILIKNLLLGYLSSSTADKSSVLRVFATVLDFDESEKDKAGLNHANSQNGWFSRLGASNVPTKEQETSLAAAFVKFLENASEPKPQLPALPISTASLSRPGHSRTHSSSSTQSTLLLSNVNLPTFPDFIPARNTGSILKEVLKDS